MFNPSEPLEPRLLFSTAPQFAAVQDGLLRITGTSADDTIRVSRAADDPQLIIVRLNETEHRFSASDSIDRLLLRGGAGDDRIRSFINLPTTVRGDAGEDTLRSGPGDDLIFGGVGDDVIHASVSRDVVRAGPGDDVVPFRNGRYVESGDVVVQFGYEGRLLITASGQADRIRVTHPAPSDVELLPVRLDLNGRRLSLTDPRFSTPPRARRVVLFAGDGDDDVQINSDDPTLDVILHGQRGFDRLSSPDSPATLFGGAGNDTLLGSNLADHILGNHGNDSILADDGPDLIDAGKGHDRIDPGLGRDTVNAGPGDDRIFNFNPDVAQDFDQLRGGTGDDTAQGDEKDEYLDSVEHVVPFDA